MDTDHLCKCFCHTEPALHFKACCFTCKGCNQNIKMSKVTEHKKQCVEEQKQ